MPSYVRAGIRKCARIRALSYASGKHIIVINEIPIRLGFHFSNGAEKGECNEVNP